MLPNDLMASLLDFRRNREWEQFHTAKNLAASISVEANELLEVFQWVNDDEIDEVVKVRRADIEREVADVAILLSYLCNDLEIDLKKCVRDKLIENELNCPGFSGGSNS